MLHNKLWTSQKFTRGQAWVDLLLLAKYKPGIFYVRDVLIEYQRGDITEGVVNLSSRWRWSRGKTQNFLNYLEKTEQQIRQQKLGVITLITITNYEQYQQNGQQTEQQNDNKMTIERQYNDTHKKVKKDKKVKNIGGRVLIIEDYFLNLLPIDLEPEKVLAWADWVDYRKEIKKKLTKSTAIKQVKDLLEHPNFIECINQSIKNGWQGLFPIKTDPKEEGYKAKPLNSKCIFCGKPTTTIIDKKPVCNFDHLTLYNNGLNRTTR